MIKFVVKGDTKVGETVLLRAALIGAFIGGAAMVAWLTLT